MHRLLIVTVLLSMQLVPVGTASADDTTTGTTTRISVASDGTQANNMSRGAPAISADGTTIVYRSDADNLVPDDTNKLNDVFAYDTTTGTTTRISVASDGTQANNMSDDGYAPAVSANGTTIVYESYADNLVPNDTNGGFDAFGDPQGDIFAYDTTTGTTTRISVASDGTQANGGSRGPAISADGTTIVYLSDADNLVPDDTNSDDDIFAYDTTTGTTTRISVASDGTQANGSSGYPEISTDGTTVVYTSSADNLVVGDTNEFNDVFAYDTTTGTTTRISVASDGTQANRDSWAAAISADGTIVVYMSDATNLVPDDTNGETDIFAYDTTTGTTIRISVASDGTQTNGFSYLPAVSADGTTIVYASSADTLVAGDTNGETDVFAYDTTTGTTTRISVASDGTQANDSSGSPAISADGTIVVYASRADNLVAGDTNNAEDVFRTRLDDDDVTRRQLAAFLARALRYITRGRIPALLHRALG